MDQVLEALQDSCKIESPARMEGKRMVALLAPKVGGTKPAAPKADKPKAAVVEKPKPAAPENAPAADTAAPVASVEQAAKK